MKRLILLLFSLCCLLPAQADEGMWMLANLNKKVRRDMKERGLEMSLKQLFHPKKASLKDAIVSFGGFCSGVVVSEEGLLLTNHHCGFSSVQQHSSTAHDYLQDGFVARNREEELSCPELYARFLVSQEDVTKRVLAEVTPTMDEAKRTAVIDSMVYLIEEEAYRKDTTLVAMVDAYYGGTEFWLSTYRDYNDVRLVYAPPTSVGKFGWDTDNWMWPRHTGDFCVFRIYADADNQPADYSPDNRPYRPRYVAPVSVEGYREGDFCMTIGYPGSTERYLSSYGIEEMMLTQNQAQIDVRGVKQAIWERAMDRSDSIRIKYASKYDESSNYWKNSIGMNRSIKQLKILEKKRAAEQELLRWIRQNRTADESSLLHLFTDLELNYEARREGYRAQAYLLEAFFNAAELFPLALAILNLDIDGDEQQLQSAVKEITNIYADYDKELDKEVFVAMLDTYRKQVPTEYLPMFYLIIDGRHAGSAQAFADSIYQHTALTDIGALHSLLQRDSTFNAFNDAATDVCLDLLVSYMQLNASMQQTTEKIQQSERMFSTAMRRMYAARNFYPDANSTMRLSFGAVAGYQPADGVVYDYYTTTQGILEKEKRHKGDKDFYVQPEILSLLQGDFGRLADENGEMRVCFITDNDITGGNSGSAMFNGNGELIGLAFDGNWEAMSSDLQYEPHLQRCIGVDVRYMLFIIEHYGNAKHIVEEMMFGSDK
ncbi:MAG: S46 family peptidase [Mediterranea massiliensis]|nr:S46 family peptidase [Mediterranea massiliensis]